MASRARRPPPSNRLKIVVIGPSAQKPVSALTIGASTACDGQILVMEDMLGLSPRVPRFVKKFGKVGEVIEDAIKSYAEDVRTGAFPMPEHTYSMKDGAPKTGKRAVRPARKATKKPKNPRSKG